MNELKNRFFNSLFLMFYFVFFVVALLVAGDVSDSDCCLVRRVSSRKSHYCDFPSSSLLCSKTLQPKCVSVSTYGISTVSGFSADFVALAAKDKGCKDALLSFYCSYYCGDCYSDGNSSFLHRGPCNEFVFFIFPVFHVNFILQHCLCYIQRL